MGRTWDGRRIDIGSSTFHVQVHVIYLPSNPELEPSKMIDLLSFITTHSTSVPVTIPPGGKLPTRNSSGPPFHMKAAPASWGALVVTGLLQALIHPSEFHRNSSILDGKGRWAGTIQGNQRTLFDTG